MAFKKNLHTRKEVSDQVAADALGGGGKSGPLLTHDAMQNTEQNPQASATDASTDDDEGSEWGGADDSQGY
jgi:hypothetical protein